MNQEDVLLMKDVKDGCFLVKHFYLLLATVRILFFPSVLFGTLGCPPKLASLLGKLLGAKCLL